MSAEWRPVRQSRTHELVLERIEERVLAGELKAGDRLPPERELAPVLGVSRSALREALRVLETIGVLVAQAGRGPDAGARIVRNPDDALGRLLRLHFALGSYSLHDVLEARVVLERSVSRPPPGTPRRGPRRGRSAPGADEGTRTGVAISTTWTPGSMSYRPGLGQRAHLHAHFGRTGVGRPLILRALEDGRRTGRGHGGCAEHRAHRTAASGACRRARARRPPTSVEGAYPPDSVARWWMRKPLVEQTERASEADEAGREGRKLSRWGGQSRIRRRGRDGAGMRGRTRSAPSSPVPLRQHPGQHRK